MRIKFMSLLAAIALLGACETVSEGSGKTGGSGVANAKPIESYTAPLGKTMTVKPGSQQDLVVNVGDRVFFGYDEFSLNSDARATLNKQAAWMRANPSVTVRIEGHCDERGTREYNLALGERRANSIADYLSANGISSNRLVTLSWGKEKPVANGSNKAAWRQNRRGVTVRNGGKS
jgi:peptidoglycan-associated lipoprotein